MSAERRAYGLRGTLPTPEDTPERVFLWDDIAQRNAAQQARRASLRDPDAALALTSQLVSQPIPAAPNLYNPPELYARMLHAERLKPDEIDAMDYARFFALVREVSLIHEREQDEIERIKAGREGTQLPTAAYQMAHREDQ